MSILVDKSTRLVVQGLTGREGTFHAKASQAYGTQVVGGVTRFVISPALLNSFLPKRKQVVDDFLNDKPPVVIDPTDPIGGRRTH